MHSRRNSIGLRPRIETIFEHTIETVGQSKALTIGKISYSSAQEKS